MPHQPSNQARPERTVTDKPNVIWIFGDQHRAQALGINGDPNIHTPHLDRFAAEGLSFTQAVAGFPLCCPFRGSLLSGQYPHRCVPGHEYQMPPETPTIAHAFRESGYHTAYFGKWHLDGFKERGGRAAFHHIPPERRGGFDQWCGYENNNAQWDSWVQGGEGDSAFHYRLPGFETDCLTDLLIEYLRGRPAEGENRQPFFAVLSVQPPHDPYIAPAEWMGRHTPGQIRLRPNVPDVPAITERARRELAGYYAQIENLDWNFGRIRAALETAGLAKSTHLIFFSDHGDMHGSHGHFLKTSPYAESLNIPFIVGGGALSRYPYRCGRTNAPINHVDIAPTTLGLCGLPVPAGMAGTDYSGCRRHDGAAPSGGRADSAFIQSVIPTGHGDSIDRPWRGVVTPDGWKYVVLSGQPWLLFNLREDPYEQVNLAYNSRYRTEHRRLRDRLGQWLTDTGDQFNLPEV